KLERRQFLSLRRRAGRQRRLLADDGVVEDPAVVADHGARVNNRGLRDEVTQASVCSSEPCSCSSARTTATPSRAASSGSPSPATRLRKCSHSSRSGSSFGILGLWLSPALVIHSP